MLFSATLGIVDFFPVVPWLPTASMHLGTDAGEGLDEKRVDSFEDSVSLSLLLSFIQGVVKPCLAIRIQQGCRSWDRRLPIRAFSSDPPSAS